MLVKDESWKAKAAAKRLSTIAKIPKEWLLDKEDLAKASKQRDLTGPFIEQYLSAEEVEIVRQNSVSIVNNIRGGKYSALEVARAFCKTAAISHQINNCLHEIFFDQALKRAQELDDHFVATGATSGPLHGLPISLKDQFHVRGHDTTMGYVGWINTYEGSDDPRLVHKVNSQIVLELVSLGAVLYCKTSLPQTLLLGETVNNIIGTSLNPINRNLSCGGSSGAYELRIEIPGETTYASSVGFLGTSLDALHLLMSTVLSTQPWLRDPYVVNIPWRQHITDATLLRAASDGSSTGVKPLKLGIYWTDGVVTPHPPIARGLHMVVDAVKKAGHKVVEWRPPSQTTAKRVHLAFLKADGAHDIHRQLDLSGEPLIPQLQKTFELKDPISLLEYQALTIEGKAYEAAYSDYWNTTAEECCN
ncbi:MAG: hypothetical protein M1816_002138 [Peltula sp. TS41687]|nr:MAG: hypothetical protein M1816_002138 [Peltula sp. TS41687]